MFLMTSTPMVVSANDMQQRLGIKRYEPVWYMMQKIRKAIRRANASVQLTGTVEHDHKYYTAHRSPELGDKLFNRGQGIVRKHLVLVTVEYREGAKPKSAGCLRMEHLPNLKGTMYFDCAQRLLRPNTVMTTDANSTYKAMAPHVKTYQG